MNTSESSPLESEPAKPRARGLSTKEVRRVRAEATHRTEVEGFEERERSLRPSWGLLLFFALLCIAVGWSIGYAGDGLGWW